MTARGTNGRRAIQHEDHPSPIRAGKATMAISKHFRWGSHEVWTGIYDETSSNSAFLVTEDGVLVVDTRQHPRDGQDLLNRIRRLTDKPIRAQRYCAHHGAGR